MYEKWIEKQREFLKEYIELCKKHNCMFECEDPYCCMLIYPLHKGHIEEMEENYNTIHDDDGYCIYNEEYEKYGRYTED